MIFNKSFNELPLQWLDETLSTHLNERYFCS